MPTLKGHVILHHTADSVVVENQFPPHRLCTEELQGQFHGLDNVKAEYFAAAQVYTQGSERFLAQVLEVYGFDDGSALAVKAEVAKSAPGTDTYAGVLTVIGGSGRFAGVTGSGKLTGTSDGTHARHDIEITYSTP